jgi:branched-chain amino acid transport system substrate-binding protein
MSGIYTSANRRSFLVGATASVASFVAPAVLRAQGSPLKIGVLLPRSGLQAGLGQDCQRAVDIAPGILLSLGLPDLAVMNGDTESNVDTARARAEQLIGSGAQLLIGAFDSGQTTAIAQVAEQKGIPLVINIAAAPAITEQGYRFVFRNFPTAQMILAGAFAAQKEVFAAAGAEPKTVVFMHVNDTYGSAMAKGIGAVMPKFDMPYTIAEEIAYDPAAHDLSVEVAKAKATNADALLVVSRLNDAMLLTRELVKQRWTPQAILSMGPGWFEDQYLKTLGKLSDGPISFTPWYDPHKRLTQVLEGALAKAAPGINLSTNTLIPACPRALRLSRPMPDPWSAYAALLDAVADRAKTFDVIHCHTDWIHMPLLLRGGVTFVTEQRFTATRMAQEYLHCFENVARTGERF